MTKHSKNDNENYQTASASYSHYNYLFGKVILLVANDTVILCPLITQLAQKGADIALIYQQLSQETIRRIKESVESLGQRFLLVKDTEEARISAERLIQTVTASLGKLDVFIDLSAQQSSHTQAENTNGHQPEEAHPNWKLMQAALNEIAKS